MTLPSETVQGEQALPPGIVARILVVDDDEANRESLRRRLARRGYTVAVAEDGLGALRQIAASSFDLVLLDVMMPGMNGLEVLDRIRQTYSTTHLPVIMATARDDTADIVAAFERGASDYVTKPLDFGVVLARVQTQISLKKSVARVLALEERLSLRNAELEAANQRLSEAADRARRELAAAARVQEALLPSVPPSIGGLRFAWVFKPCQELAGDSFNVFSLDAEHIAMYVLDVSGHGVAASLLAVAATRFLSPSNDADSILVQPTPGGARLQPALPAKVAERLNRKLSWNASTEQFLTLFYAVLNVTTREFTFVSAGHPAGVWIRTDGTAGALEGSGMPIGVGETYEQQSVRLSEGDRLYLYSDGITETMNSQRDLFGRDRLMQTLLEGRNLSLDESVSRLLAELQRWSGDAVSRDDVTVLAVECQKDGIIPLRPAANP